MSLLAKRKGDVTPEDRQFLEKEFGVPGLPFPMLKMREVDDGKGGITVEPFIGVLEDKDEPLIVTSERSREEVIGMMYRNMPIPSMLPMWREIWRRMQIDSSNRVFMSKGRPGVGKTFLCELAAAIASERPPL